MRIPWRNRSKVTPDELYMEFTRIDADLIKLRQSIAAIPTGSSSVSIALSLSGKELRVGKETLTAGANTITFSAQMGTPYTVLFSARNAAGLNQEVTITGETLNGFSATVFEACTLDYIAIQT